MKKLSRYDARTCAIATRAMTKDQRVLLADCINRMGGGGHPFAVVASKGALGSVDGFALSFAIECVDKTLRERSRDAKYVRDWKASIAKSARALRAMLLASIEGGAS